MGADTTLVVTITTAHAIPKKGKLHIGVSAPWNDGAADSPVDYFSSITCNSLIVGGRRVADGTYVCSFFDNNRVEVDRGFNDRDVPANTVISISIVGFRNPICPNIPFDVFAVFTTGEDWEHTVDYSRASLTVTEPATLTGGLLQVAEPPIQVVDRGVV